MKKNTKLTYTSIERCFSYTSFKETRTSITANCSIMFAGTTISTNTAHIFNTNTFYWYFCRITHNLHYRALLAYWSHWTRNLNWNIFDRCSHIYINSWKSRHRVLIRCLYDMKTDLPFIDIKNFSVTLRIFLKHFQVLECNIPMSYILTFQSICTYT